MLVLQQKQGAPPLFGEGCCKFKGSIFFNALISVTAIQDSVQYHHGDTLSRVVTKKKHRRKLLSAAACMI